MGKEPSTLSSVNLNMQHIINPSQEVHLGHHFQDEWGDKSEGRGFGGTKCGQA